MKRRKHSSRWEWIVDVLLWVPELLIMPVRMLFWLLRGIGKVVINLFDGI
ncbi:hypothetical protein [Halobacillus salinus]|nr:hypothetical protein [Halobacillus salinus]